MLDWFARWIRPLALRLAALLAIVLATIVGVFAVQARLRLPDLQPWHRLALAEEYRVDRRGAPQSFEEYLALEARLATELQRRLLDHAELVGGQPLSRFDPHSVPGRLALGGPHNRSHELAPEGPARGAVLLVHGLTDSPYSLRALAGELRAQGFHVVLLRLPGHGTLPAGLLDVRWEDWLGATLLAAKHAAARAGGGPLLGAGYSTGATLLALLALRGLEDASLPRFDRLFLVSAAIGVSDLAALANVASALSVFPYFEKAKWLDVLPEYDPYKYNSFPVNAGNQVYRLTRQVQRALADAEERGRLGEMPRVVVFQSVVDATVSAADVVKSFLWRLPGPGHELIAFDVNRRDRLAFLGAEGPRETFEAIRDAPALPFALTLVTNRSASVDEVAAFRREAGSRATRSRELGLAWPPGVVSLGHVALPFPLDDPVYGLTPSAAGEDAYPLGAVNPRGEAGSLIVPLGNFARLRSNPFFDVIRGSVVAAIAQPQASPGPEAADLH
jgi:alpha-beta hydrolase superfamily lysophospholipase